MRPKFLFSLVQEVFVIDDRPLSLSPIDYKKHFIAMLASLHKKELFRKGVGKKFPLI
jgi:hypothetical protein